MKKIKIHSTVDLITNSSTVIYTFSQGSLPALKELVNEILLTFDRTEKFDDIFFADVFLDEIYQYEMPEDFEDIDDVIEAVLTQQLLKPDWMKEAEDLDYERETTLYIKAKDEKYTQLAEKLTNYLYSTSHEASYEG